MAASSAIGKDNIALDKRKQSALMKSVKRVKKDKGKEEEGVRQKRAIDKRSSRGIIMLEHVPHGFFEEEMRNYFSQFGKVRRVRLARSKKTGKSRGYAYVEFEFREVAQIAAEAMNNYLMFERLIKCRLLAPTEKPRKIFRDKFVTAKRYPKLVARSKRIAAEAEILSEEESKNILQQRLNKIKEQNKRFAEMGINYHFNIKTKDTVEKMDDSAEDIKDEKVNDNIEEVKDEEPSSEDESDTGLDLNDEDEDESSLDVEEDDIGKIIMGMDSDSQSDDEGLDEDEDDEVIIPPVPTKSPKSQRNSFAAVAEAKKSPAKSPKSQRNSFAAAAETTKSPAKSPKSQRNSFATAVETKKSPAKSPKSQRNSFEAAADDRKSPASAKSPKSQRNSSTPAADDKKTSAKFVAKYSPKLLRSRKSVGPTPQTPTAKETLPNPNKLPKGRKSESAVLASKTMPKYSPKLLRSRQSEANPQTPSGKQAKKTPAKEKTDLPRVSPKMLRSRKSEAPSTLTPMKKGQESTPSKQKKAGRKSAF